MAAAKKYAAAGKNIGPGRDLPPVPAAQAGFGESGLKYFLILS